jgi:hypothetical protein
VSILLVLSQLLLLEARRRAFFFFVTTVTAGGARKGQFLYRCDIFSVPYQILIAPPSWSFHNKKRPIIHKNITRGEFKAIY